MLRAPLSPEARAALAQSLLDAGAPAEAAAHADSCLAEDPFCVPALLLRAEAARRQGDHAAAAAAYQQAAARAPSRPSILVSAALSLIALDRLAEAEPLLRRAVALAPRDTAALVNLGSVLVRRGNLAAAELPCRAALLADPTLVAAHQNLSAILAESDPAAARAHRDAAYSRQQVFIAHAPAPRRAVLVLSAADAANIPLRHLLDLRHTTLVSWYVEYATPDQDRALPPVDLVFNGMGEAELTPAFPPCVSRLLRNRRAHLLNPPDRVARTARAEIPALLGGIRRVRVPAVRRCPGRAEAAAAAAELGLPVLVRPLGTHGGQGLARVTDAQALAALPEAPCTVTEFIDFAAPDAWYRKYRVIFIDRAPYPLHLAIGPRWLVHHCTAGMESDTSRQTEEHAYLRDPEAAIGLQAWTALHEIGARLDLDYAGIDFTVRPDGSVLVFEANPAMLVHPEDENGPFAYRNPSVRRIQTAFEAMLCRREGRK